MEKVLPLWMTKYFGAPMISGLMIDLKDHVLKYTDEQIKESTDWLN